jgi:hypothetical protein
MRTSDGFDGTNQTGVPVLSPGLYTFPVQSKGGLYEFHKEPVCVKGISYKGTGDLQIIKMIRTGTEALIATIAGGEGEFFEDILLTPGEALKFSNSGAGTVSVTGMLVIPGFTL